MKSKNKNILACIMLGTGLLALSSCGGGGSGGGGSHTKPGAARETQESVEAEMDGQYVAHLTTINQSVAGLVSGAVTLSREDNQLVANVRFSGFHPGVLHSQYIHVGSSCPTNDDNADGFIDAVETYNSAGKVLIPLDADLSSQDRGSSIWTVADTAGSYNYSETTGFDKLMADLHEGDMDPDDDFVKLDADKGLGLTNRVVIIYGVAPETQLPSTVARRGRLANFQTLPVACGVFRKVVSVPGTADDDRSVGEASGESIGGSSGADDGATVIVGETTGSSDGSTTGGSTGWTTGGGSTGWTDGGSTAGDTTGGSTSGDTTGGSTSAGTTGGETTGSETSGGGFMGGWHWPWETGGSGGSGGTSGGTQN